MATQRIFQITVIFSIACVLSFAQNSTSRHGKSESVDENVIEDSVDFTLANADNDVPYHIRKNFPYYISGFDEDNQPILVVEFGKWKVRQIIEKGGPDLKMFEKYIDVIFKRFVTFQNLKRSEEYPVEGTAVLVDLEGFNLFQFASVPTVRMILGWAKRLQELQEHLAYAVLINTNFVAEQLVNLARPILGSTFERFDIHGTNENKWRTALLKKFPGNQIPPWYGGSSKNYTPVAVFG